MLTIQASRQPAFSAGRQQVSENAVGRGTFITLAWRIGCGWESLLGFDGSLHASNVLFTGVRLQTCMANWTGGSERSRVKRQLYLDVKQMLLQLNNLPCSRLRSLLCSIGSALQRCSCLLPLLFLHAQFNCICNGRAHPHADEEIKGLMGSRQAAQQWLACV